MKGRGARRVAAATLLGTGGLLYAREVEPRWVEVRRVELTLPRLAPEFDGYRVAQIGDFHLDDWSKPERLLRVFEKVNDERPDLIAITGDFASYSARDLDEGSLIEALRLLSARDGCVAILGNHDYLTDVKLVRRCIREGGVEELINGVLTLRRGQAALHVAGIDDVMFGMCRLDLVLRELPEGGAAILLAHEPDFADVSCATGRFDLQLSGHSHGGQVDDPAPEAPGAASFLAAVRQGALLREGHAPLRQPRPRIRPRPAPLLVPARDHGLHPPIASLQALRSRYAGQSSWITERTLPAGSLNHAMGWPSPRKMPLSSVSS